MNRCDSGTDSKVWMEEEGHTITMLEFRAPVDFFKSTGAFLSPKIK